MNNVELPAEYLGEPEVWKQYNKSFYYISSLGRIYSGKSKIILKPGKSTNGYRQISFSIDKVTSYHRVHVLVWLTFKGSRNNKQVDHIDNDKDNNRLDNLQLLTNRENTAKFFKTKKTSSKYTGVYWRPKDLVWVAQITVNGKAKHLGTFHDERAAARAYREAAKEAKKSLIKQPINN